MGVQTGCKFRRNKVKLSVQRETVKSGHDDTLVRVYGIKQCAGDVIVSDSVLL